MIPITSLAPSHPFTTTVDDADNADNVDDVDDVDDVASSLIDILGNDLSDITEENIISYIPNSTSPTPTTIIPPTISTQPTSISRTTPSTLTTHQIISTPPTSISHTTRSTLTTHQIISTPPTSISCPTILTPPTSICCPTISTPPTSISCPIISTTPTSLTHPTITTQPSTSKATSSSLTTESSSPVMRDFFLEFLKSKSPIDRASRSRQVASLGESLTANKALQRQKEYIDDKKR